MAAEQFQSWRLTTGHNFSIQKKSLYIQTFFVSHVICLSHLKKLKTQHASILHGFAALLVLCSTRCALQHPLCFYALRHWKHDYIYIYIYIYMVGNCIYYQRAQLQPGFQEPMRVQPRMVWQGLCHSFHQECWFRVTTTSTKNSAVIHLAQKTSCAHSVCPSCSLFVCSSKRLAQQNWSSRLQKWWTFCPGVSVTNSYLCIYIYI